MAAEPKNIATDRSFRRRALAEAARYGSDPWVFLRELLQNARDAGARQVELTVAREGSWDRVSCRDDGCGMTYEHARRYLFALYASSKEDESAQAGKFGIGFWSVLRFEPSTITIRSRDARRDAWEISLDGHLEHVMANGCALDVGTEIVLERPSAEADDLEEEVTVAVRRYGRFLTRRDDPDLPLSVTVNGTAANSEFTLPAPCAAFRGKGFRGVVGLGSEPKVELFAQGLFVRSAKSLQDLQDAGELDRRATAEGALAELPSLAPRVLIDSAELDLLLARSDARYDKHLRRILAAAEKALGRLITRQLQALRPQPWYRLWWGALRDRIEPHLSWQLAAAGLAGLFLGLGALWWLDPGENAGALPASNPGLERPGIEPPEPQAARTRPGEAQSVSGDAEGTEPGALPAAGVRPVAPGGPRPTGERTAPSRDPLHQYSDFASSYRGPRPGALASDSSRLMLIYEPAAATLFFSALVVDDLDGTRWTAGPVDDELPRYRGERCLKGCASVRLLVAEEQGALRIPVPTGHRLEASSVRLDGAPRPVLETASGEAVLLLHGESRGVLEYRTGPAPAPKPFPPSRPPAEPPAELAAIAERIRHLPLHERVQSGLDEVAARVAYDRSPLAASSLEQAARSGTGFVEAALDAGAGDCDVQSGVLVTLLRLTGIEARLVLGYVGFEGTVAPGLHAWVEYGDGQGNRYVADASVSSGGEIFGPEPSLAKLPSTLPAGNVLTPRRIAGIATGRSPWTWLVAAALLAAASAALMRGRRDADGVELGEDEDLAALLGGALRHPEAFSGLSAMFHGRFVPLLGGSGAISLYRARRLGRKNRLFRSSVGSRLALEAAARKVPVIDASTAEGRVLSLALGAIDLDHWSSLLDRCSDTETSRRINRRLATLGASWRVREISDLAQPWIEIALEDLKPDHRLILLDLRTPEFSAARGLLPDHPEAGAFSVLDVLLHRLDLPDRERARILAAFARPAVDSASNGEVEAA